MESMKLRTCFIQDVTIISNEFLDRFLPEANGDFLKIYLYMLRCAGRRIDSLSVSGIADRMNCTEADVCRALRYWEKEGALSITRNDEGKILEIAFTGNCRPEENPDRITAVKSSDISSERLTELGEREDIRELLFIAQQYIGRPLTRTEIQKVCFFYDGLHLSPDLIDYLIEYCVSRGHKSFHYIEKVALNWKDQGIATVHDARVAAGSYHKEYYDILKALGIDNHHPIEAEIRIMKKWLEKYEFSMDIIREACTRTVMGAAKPTLNYTDSILSKWNSKGVRTMDDIRALDEEHVKSSTPKKVVRPERKNSFNDFEQREYDYTALAAQLQNK